MAAKTTECQNEICFMRNLSRHDLVILWFSMRNTDELQYWQQEYSRRTGVLFGENIVPPSELGNQVESQVTWNKPY